MNYPRFTLFLLLGIIFSLGSLHAQQTISQGLGVFVFPTNDQDKETQEYDEFQCYKWAKEQSGIDPMNIKVEAKETQTGPDGSAARGAAKGAVVGAALGAITGDAGEGAALGATAGAFSGLGQGRRNRIAQRQAAQTSAAQKEQQLRETFKKAFSVCMEGKGYNVK